MDIVGTYKHQYMVENIIYPFYIGICSSMFLYVHYLGGDQIRNTISRDDDDAAAADDHGHND